MSNNQDIIKSQDELNTCNDGKRGSEVLLATIEKCEVLEKENKQFRQLLKECKPLFFPYVKDMPLSRDKALNLLIRINAVIGESEE